MTRAKLALEDGTVFEGTTIGSSRPVCGEVVFNTGMAGYVEALTDPSFAGQILTFTYPLIGNYGVPKPEYVADRVIANFESETVHAPGVVAGECAVLPSHYLSLHTISAWLDRERVPGIFGIDTRALTL